MHLISGQERNELEKKSFERVIALALLRSRGAKSRRRVLITLLSDSKSCSQIAKELHLNWRTVNWHLQVLVKENYVKTVNFGQRKYFELTQKGKDSVDFFKK